jgi:FHA domain-containing protein
MRCWYAMRHYSRLPMRVLLGSHRTGSFRLDHSGVSHHNKYCLCDCASSAVRMAVEWVSLSAASIDTILYMMSQHREKGCMRPLASQQKTTEELQVFIEAAENWIQRPRNPQADAALLDAVQRRQERYEDKPRAHVTSAGNGTHATPSAAVIGAACLVKLQGEQRREAWLLPCDRPALVGRSGKKTSFLDVDLWPDTAVSRRHALIWCDGKGWYIEDLRSANGTLLDNSDIRGQRAMHLIPGSTIRFGHTLLKLTTLESENGYSMPASADGSEAGC